jgi:hypothetical protein
MEPKLLRGKFPEIDELHMRSFDCMTKRERMKFELDEHRGATANPFYWLYEYRGWGNGTQIQFNDGMI